MGIQARSVFYETFDPQRTRALAEQIWICFTPQHRSWQNVAEAELSALPQRRLGQRRIGDLATVQRETAPWPTDASQRQRGVARHMTINHARFKLQSVYLQHVT